MIGIRTLLATSIAAAALWTASPHAPCVAAETSGDLGTWSTPSGSAVTTVYLADRAHTGTGDIIDEAALVVRDGKIVDLTTRESVQIEPGWKVVELTGSTLMPGMVIAETGLLGGGDEERTLSPEIRSVDGFDFFADYDSLLASGITTVQISAGQNRLLPGQTAVVKLAGDDPLERTISEIEALRLQLTQSAFATPTIYEPPVAAVSVERPLEATRFQVASDLPSALLTVRALWKATEGDSPEDPDDALIVESIKPFVGEKTVRVTARSANEIVAALDLMEELDQPFILVAPSRIVPVIDRLVSCKQLRGIVLEHDVRPGSWVDVPDPESKELRPKSVAEKWRMLKSRLPKEMPIALKPISDGDLTDIRFLVSMLASEGLGSEALTTVTGDAASLLGVVDHVGVLAAGTHADFVVLSGEPLEPQTTVLQTYVDGVAVYGAESTDDSILLSGATLCLPDGSEAVAEVSVAGRSIRAIGSSVSAAPLGKTYTLDGCYITPGFIDAGTRLGGGRAITSRISIGDKLGKYLVPDDDSVRRGRMGGVSIGLLASDSLPSPVVAFKLGDEPRVLKDPVAIRSRLSGNPTTAAESLKKTLKGAKAYADSWVAYDKKAAEYKVALAKYEAEKKKYDEAVAKKKAEEAKAKSSSAASKSTPAKKPVPSPSPKPTPKPSEEKKDSSEAKTASDSKSSSDAKKSTTESKPTEKSSDLKAPTKPTAPKPPRSVSTLEPYRAVFKLEIPLIIEVNEEAGVETALSVVVDEYKVRLVLVASGTAYLAADKIGEKKVPVIVGPSLTTQRNGRSYNLPQHFRTAGCPVLVQTRATTSAASLPQVIAHSASRGLGRGDAVQALTLDAADVFKLNNVGQIKPGFDADLTVFDGPPFYPSSRVIGVMIDGEWAYLDSRYDSYASKEAR
ncbi:MAG: amidohydrolase family protein [Planctomycetota bacterium]